MAAARHGSAHNGIASEGLEERQDIVVWAVWPFGLADSPLMYLAEGLSLQPHVGHHVLMSRLDALVAQPDGDGR